MSFSSTFEVKEKAPCTLEEFQQNIVRKASDNLTSPDRRISQAMSRVLFRCFSDTDLLRSAQGTSSDVITEEDEEEEDEEEQFERLQVGINQVQRMQRRLLRTADRLACQVQVVALVALGLLVFVVADII